MAADNPLLLLLEQLSFLLQSAEDASKQTFKGPPPEDAGEKIKKLKAMVAQFKAMNESYLQRSNLSTPPAPQPMSKEDRITLERANELAKAAKRGYDDLTFGIKMTKRKAEAPKTRKKKFDRLGGRKKWKPL